MLLYGIPITERIMGGSVTHSYHDIIEENLWEDFHDMSFAGMCICGNGMIAFADSKASRQSSLGNNFQDHNRGPIQKIFSSKDYMFIYVGSNEFSHRGKIIFIEDYMNEQLPKTNTWQELFVNAYDFIFAETQLPSFAIEFVLAQKNEKAISHLQKYSVRRIIFTADQLLFSPRYYKTNDGLINVYTIGNSHYTRQEKRLYQGRDNIFQTEKIIKEEVEKMIQEADAFNEYNPVGLPVQTAILQ